MIKIEKEHQVNSLKAGDLLVKYPVMGEPADELVMDQGNLDKYEVSTYNPTNGLWELIIIEDKIPPAMAALTHSQSFKIEEKQTIEKHWRKLITEKKWWVSEK